MSSAPQFDASFRDPAGRLHKVGPRILRTVRSSGAPELDAFLATAAAGTLVESGRLVGTRPVEGAEATSLGLTVEAGAKVVEHDAIPFPSFPYEWAPEMLREAGLATLDISEELLAEGWGLKDATPYNVLFRGPKPVFVDLLSFERRAPGDVTWLPYAQFVRTFLLPLLVHGRFGTPLSQVFLHRRDGLEPEDVYPLFGLRKFFPPLLTMVTLPVLLAGAGEKKAASAAATSAASAPATNGRAPDPEKARFILGYLLRSLRKRLESLGPRGDRSRWSNYMDVGQNNYTEAFLAEKEAFVTAALGEVKPASVLDVGCNTGHFSAMAAKSGARVVAIDYDPACVGRVWQRAKAEKLDVLPLVVDLTRPSPAVGWRNREQPSFLERAKDFDLVLMLAVIHHMLVSERVPLDEILAMASQLTKDAAVIEYVGPGDSMFKRIARGRDALHADLTPEVFEAACAKHFRIVRFVPTGDHRRLYLLRK